MEVTSKTRKVRFGGAFEVELRSGQLYKHGVRLKLQDQPFQVLAILLERAGELVTREELQQKLWPSDCFVDFDTGLNNAIKKLRDALGDSAEEPRYIETVPRRGYCFIAHVENGNGDLPIHDIAAPVLPVKQPQKTWNHQRSIATAVAAILLLFVGAVSYRFLFARPVLAESDVILVASFVNKTGDSVFDNSLDKALEIKLAESPFLSLFPEPEVRATMRMMRHDPSERVTRELGIEICNRQSLKAVIVPEIAVLGDKYLITLEAIDARSQKAIAQQQVEALNKEQVIAALGKAGSQLRRRLGESLSSLEKYDAPLDFATTNSLEALQSYRTGLLQFRMGKPHEAIALLERAVQLDPQFCSAYRALGVVSINLGDREASRTYHAKAFELKDRHHLTREESFLTTATYHLSVTGNMEKAMAELLLYKEAYPRSTIAHNVLGVVYQELGKTELALEEYRWAVGHARVPASTDSGNVSQALMTLDRLDEAKKTLDDWWRQRGLLDTGQQEQRYRIAFFENDTATMERLARELPADDLFWIALQQHLAFFRGDSNRLRSLTEDLVNQHRRTERKENAAIELAWYAFLESQLGNYSSARALCRQADEAGRGSDLVLAHCAKALAEAGDLAQAEVMAAKLDRVRAEDTLNHKVQLPLIRSAIERKRGNGAKAVELLLPVARYEQGEPQVLYQRALAYLEAGDPAKAAAEFEKLLGHRGWIGWTVFAPLSQLGLARAHALLGNLEDSREAYENFFVAWENADVNMPRLRQAKAEYSKLTSVASVVKD